MNRIRVGGALLAAVAGVVLLSGFRGGGCGGHREMNPERVQRMATDRVDDVLDDVDATDVQRQKIHAVKDRLLKEGLALREANKQGREFAKAQWNSPNPDRAGLHTLVDQRIEAMRLLAHQAVDGLIEVHQTLTPEQRKQLSDEFLQHGR